MTKRSLPAVQALTGRAGIGFELPASAASRWQPALNTADDAAETVIEMLDVIGEDFWMGGGVTAKRVTAELRAAGAGDVTVHLNSPGGDFFEGLAIYNALREHPGAVTVKVLGLAASAASIIAMAGDRVEMPRAGFMMIHNVWVVAAGNRHDMRAVADVLEPFDAALADVYAARTGLDTKAIAAMLDRETWLGGSEAVEKGFADGLLAADAIAESAADDSGETAAAALYRLDALLAAKGVARSDRRKLLKDLTTGMPRAAEDAKPGAGVMEAEAEFTAIGQSVTQLWNKR